MLDPIPNLLSGYDLYKILPQSSSSAPKYLISMDFQPAEESAGPKDSTLNFTSGRRRSSVEHQEENLDSTTNHQIQKSSDV